MIGVNRKTHAESSYYPFTEKQWEELEKQVLTFRYIMSGVSVPPALMSTVITTTSATTSPSALFPLHQQPSLPFGLGSFQVGYGYGRKVDVEPGRCKRTDGKKWRCAKEAHPDSKYCEKHMRRPKSKAQKQSDALNNNTLTKTVTNINPTTTSAASRSYLPYPAVSYGHVSQSNYGNNCKYHGDSTTPSFYSMVSAQSSSTGGMSTRDNSPSASSHWLGLDGGLHDLSDKQEIRYSNEMFSEASKATSTVKFHENKHTNYKNVDEEEHDEEKLAGDKEHDTQKLYHHFLGDWPSKLKTTPAIRHFSTSNN